MKRFLHFLIEANDTLREKSVFETGSIMIPALKNFNKTEFAGNISALGYGLLHSLNHMTQAEMQHAGKKLYSRIRQDTWSPDHWDENEDRAARKEYEWDLHAWDSFHTGYMPVYNRLGALNTNFTPRETNIGVLAHSAHAMTFWGDKEKEIVHKEVIPFVTKYVLEDPLEIQHFKDHFKQSQEQDSRKIQRAEQKNSDWYAKRDAEQQAGFKLWSKELFHPYTVKDGTSFVGSILDENPKTNEYGTEIVMPKEHFNLRYRQKFGYKK